MRFTTMGRIHNQTTNLFIKNSRSINMRNVNYYFFCLFFVVAVMAGCKKDDGGDPSPEDAALTKLQGTWNLTNATRDASNITSQYEDLTIVINNKTLTAQGAPGDSVFPTGTFNFKEGDSNVIVIDGINVSLSATDTNLRTSFSLDEDGSDASRVAVVQGNYIFTFTKE